MKKLLLLSMVVGLITGCVSVPFREAAEVPLDSSDPRTVVEGFREATPESFQLLSSIVFEYNWLTVAGIGVLDINAADGLYKVVCMNHLGVKLFEFEGNRNGLISQFAIEPLARQGNIAAAVGDDIKRIYFDLTPSADARITVRKHKMIFRQRSGRGALEYEFAGAGGGLARKTYREDERAVWRVSYYEYERKDGKLYPMGIILSNYRHGYRLIVRQKEIRG